jgi:hypothetical protein
MDCRCCVYYQARHDSCSHHSRTSNQQPAANEPAARDGRVRTQTCFARSASPAPNMSTLFSTTTMLSVVISPMTKHWHQAHRKQDKRCAAHNNAWTIPNCQHYHPYTTHGARVTRGSPTLPLRSGFECP